MISSFKSRKLAELREKSSPSLKVGESKNDSILVSGEYMARILCIDDEPHVLKLKCTILELAGHEVTPATSTHEAIEIMNTHQYDVMVTDWHLGEGNGRRVVQAANDLAMPVVVVSGYVAEAYQSTEPLANLYLEKPVNPEELVTIVNELLKASERASHD